MTFLRWVPKFVRLRPLLPLSALLLGNTWTTLPSAVQLATTLSLSLIDWVQFRPFDIAKASLLLTFTNFASPNSSKDILRGSTRASRQELLALMWSCGITQPCISVSRGLLLALLSLSRLVLLARSVPRLMQSKPFGRFGGGKALPHLKLSLAFHRIIPVKWTVQRTDLSLIDKYSPSPGLS